MKRFLYESLRFYVRLGLQFYFSKIQIRGRNNVPENKPVLFTANHQNAFLDALLIVAFNRRHTYFLARAGIFGHPIANFFLSLINILPIYRIRDGRHTLVKNEDVFKQCFGILEAGNALLIFPEGNHDLHRRLRPLSKGFTRIVTGALEHSDISELVVVPIGINYEHHQRFQHGVSVIFGEPFEITRFNIRSSKELKDVVSVRMKELITHIEDGYEKTVATLNAAGVDYLNPQTVKDILNGYEPPAKNKKAPLISFFLYWIAVSNNIFVILLWSIIKSRIKDPVFIGSIKFVFGIFIVPVIYFFQSLLVFLLAGIGWSIMYFLFSVFTVRWLRDTDKSTAKT